MKKQRSVLLAVGILGFASVVLFAQQLPPTLYKKPEPLPMLNSPAEWPRPREERPPIPKSPGEIDGAEMRAFRVGGKDYKAVLLHQDIKASPEWSPSRALPLGLGGVEAAARAELNKLATDGSQWETSNIQLNRFDDGTHQRWYFVVTFNPVVRPSGFASDRVVVMLTIDGKAGHAEESQ